MKLEKRKKWNYPAIGFAIPCLGMLFLMAVSQYVPFGKYSRRYSDMYHQYYSFFVAFRNALREGRGLLYTGAWVWAWTIWVSSPTTWRRP